MSTTPRFAPNSTDEIPNEMFELSAAIRSLPLEHRARLEPLMNCVEESAKRRRRILNLVQEALSQLRLDMKYLVFDLESTRRERDSYKQLLEERQNLD